MKNNKWSEEEINFLLQNYQKYTNKELGQILNRSSKAIEIKLTRLGLTRPKIHQQNDNAFEKINSPDQAYWLGFITADGFINYNKINGNYELGIELKSSDQPHLEKFKKFLNSNAVIITRTRKGHTIGNHKIKDNLMTSCIRIYSKKICEDLIKLKIYPNKNKNGIFFLNSLPENIMRDYIRGFFDGDGSVCWRLRKKGAKRLRCNFTSINKQFLTELRVVLYQNGIYSQISSWSGDYNNICYQLSIEGHQNCLNFLTYIYQDSSIFLDRKHLFFTEATLNSDI
jgi:intein/homing endonuclease